MITHAFLYKSGSLIPIDGTHSVALSVLGIDSVDDALKAGYVRLRDHGGKLAAQGRSRRLVRACVVSYLSDKPLPATLCVEWPGTYQEFTGSEIAEFV